MDYGYMYCDKLVVYGMDEIIWKIVYMYLVKKKKKKIVYMYVCMILWIGLSNFFLFILYWYINYFVYSIFVLFIFLVY